MRKSILGGLIAGNLTVWLFMIIYYFSKSAMLSGTLYWGTIVFYIFAILGVNLLIKRENRGVLPFRQAVRNGFVVYLVANAVFFIFYFWRFTTDPSLAPLQLEMMQEFANQYPPGSAARKYLDSIQIDSLEIKPFATLTRYLQGAMGGFLLSAFLAIMVKQSK